MSVSKTTRILLLQLEPAQSGDFLITSQARVRYSIERRSTAGLPQRSPTDARTWEARHSTLDNHSLITFFNDLQDTQIDGKTLFELCTNAGVSLWQFIPSRLQAAVLRTLGLIEILNPLIEETQPDLIQIIPTRDVAGHLWERTACQVATTHKVPVSVVPSWSTKRAQSFIDYHGRKTLVSSIRENVDRWSLAACSKMLLPLTRAAGNREFVGKKLLFATNARHWVRAPGTRHFHDEQFFPLLPALRKAGWTRFVGLDCSYATTKHSLSVAWTRMRDQDNKDIHWRSFLSYTAPSQTPFFNRREIQERTWHRLQTSSSFQNHFRFQGIPLLPILSNDLHDALVYFLPYVTDILAVAERIVRDEQPDALIATSEAVGICERALVIQAGLQGVPTVGLQHGMIFDNHHHYMHRSICTHPKEPPYGFVRPEITCVWGEAWKQVLTIKGHYPSQSVHITGNWRYDNLAETSRQLNASEIRSDLGIRPEKHIVLIVSGNQDFALFVDRCLELLEGKPDCVPLVKLHPLDRAEAITKLLRHRKHSSRMLLSTQLIEALWVADIVISQFSTVVSEAILLGKPVILADFDRIAGWETYTHSGICLRVTRPSDLGSAIDAILSRELPDGAMRQKQQEFVTQHFHKRDGQAAYRVAEALSDVTGVRSRFGRSAVAEDGQELSC